MITLEEQIAEARRELALRKASGFSYRPFYPVVCWTCQRPFLRTGKPKPNGFHHCSTACREKGRALRRWARIWRQIVQQGECWIWTGDCSKAGYGRVGMGSAGRIYVHRLIYEAIHGPIAPGLELDHLCRRHACCQPSHLEPVIPRINKLRGISPAAVNATKTHCPQGHPYNALNTIIDKRGGRWCRTCKRQTDHDRYHSWRRDHPVTPFIPVTHCYRGHAYDVENTYWDTKGRRRCRQCSRLLNAAYRLQKKAG